MENEFLDINCSTESNDFDLFQNIITKGIDLRFEAFIESKFEVKNKRLYMKFHKSEIHILLKRLEEIDTEHSMAWLEDIQKAKDN